MLTQISYDSYMIDNHFSMLAVANVKLLSKVHRCMPFKLELLILVRDVNTVILK